MALASWVGLPGPGEAGLVTAGVLAARGRLDVVEVTLVAWGGATIGGVAGWFVGLKGGSGVVTRPGPLRETRVRALERGHRFYDRYGAAAVFFTPSWMAGIARMSPARYLPANALAALVWALTFTLGAYFAGPPVLDIVSDTSSVVLAALIAAGLAATVLETRRRRLRRQRLR